MTVVTEFPHRVKVLEKGVWIPLKRGVKLAARIWMPVEAGPGFVQKSFRLMFLEKREGRFWGHFDHGLSPFLKVIHSSRSAGKVWT